MLRKTFVCVTALLLTSSAFAQKPSMPVPGSIKNSFTYSSSDSLGKMYEFGSPVELAGTGFVHLPLYYRTLPPEESEAETMFSSNTGTISAVANPTNYLVMNTANGSNEMLREDSTQLFLNTYILYYPYHAGTISGSTLDANYQPIRKVSNLIYTVVLEDTNQDSSFSPEDKMTLVYATPDGKTFTPFLEKVLALYWIRQVDNDRFMVMFKHEAGMFLNLYSISELKLIEQKKVQTNFQVR